MSKNNGVISRRRPKNWSKSTLEAKKSGDVEKQLDDERYSAVDGTKNVTERQKEIRRTGLENQERNKVTVKYRTQKEIRRAEQEGQEKNKNSKREIDVGEV